MGARRLAAPHGGRVGAEGRGLGRAAGRARKTWGTDSRPCRVLLCVRTVGTASCRVWSGFTVEGRRPAELGSLRKVTVGGDAENRPRLSHPGPVLCILDSARFMLCPSLMHAIIGTAPFGAAVTGEKTEFLSSKNSCW